MHAEPLVHFPAADGYLLAADLHIPTAAAPRASVLLAPAMGVPRTFYAAFARHLAEAGFAVLSVDYRGVGGSRPPRLGELRASLHDWGELDLSAAASWLSERFGELPLLFVGHSVGGQLMGLIEGAPIRGALFVASQSGYWRHWSGLGRAMMGGLWHLLIPGVVGVMGYLPMRAFGQGEDLPAGVALEWARWGRHPDYVGSYAQGRGGAGYAGWQGRLRLLAIADDSYAPEPAVQALGALYQQANKEVRVIRPADVDASKVGHFGFFRPAFRDTLWREAVDYLEAVGGLDGGEARAEGAG